MLCCAAPRAKCAVELPPHLRMNPEHLVHLFTTVQGPDLQRLFGAYAEHVRTLSPHLKAVICRALHRAARYRGDVSVDSATTSPRSSAAPLQASMHELSTIANILLCTFGSELTELKNRLDTPESSHDLINLCALFPAGLREHVLRHVQREAHVALHEWNSERSSREAHAPAGPREVWWPSKVYCDFDDTVQVRNVGREGIKRF